MFYILQKMECLLASSPLIHENDVNRTRTDWGKLNHWSKLSRALSNILRRVVFSSLCWVMGKPIIESSLLTLQGLLSTFWCKNRCSISFHQLVLSGKFPQTDEWTNVFGLSYRYYVWFFLYLICGATRPALNPQPSRWHNLKWRNSRSSKPLRRSYTKLIFSTFLI